MSGRRDAPLLWMAVAVLVLALVSVTVGAYPIGAGEALATMSRRLFGGDESASAAQATVDAVLFGIRLPRTAAAVAVGAALAMAGACYQAILRNPLVSPDILGVSAGAGLGAALAIFLALPAALIQLFAFAGGLGVVALVLALVTAIGHRGSVLSLILGGIVVGAFAGACTSLLKVMADPQDQLPAITFWLLGSLASVGGAELAWALPAVALGVVPLVLLRWRINLLSLDDDEAASLGVPVARTRLLVIACATLVTSGVVAVAGVVGWVGLVVPHVARMLVGPAFGRLLAASALLGAAYLLIVDTLARSVAAVEVPLGILTAIVGAPFFLWLLARGRRVW